MRKSLLFVGSFISYFYDALQKHTPTEDTIAKIDKTIAINCILLVPSFFSTLDTSPCSPVNDVPFAIVVSECGFSAFSSPVHSTISPSLYC